MHYGSCRVLPVLYIHGSEMKMEVQGQAEMLLVVPQLIRMGQFQYLIAISMYVCNSNYVAGESTVRIVNYTDWQTRNGSVDKTVIQLVTPKVVVCDR